MKARMSAINELARRLNDASSMDANSPCPHPDCNRIVCTAHALLPMASAELIRLAAEVERLTKATTTAEQERLRWFHSIQQVIERNPGFTWRDYPDGFTPEDAAEFFSADMQAAWGQVEAAERRADEAAKAMRERAAKTVEQYGWQIMPDMLSHEVGRIADEVRALPLPGENRWRHKKRGSTYIEVGRGTLQTSMPIPDNTALVVYRSEENGSLWARPVCEFEDGRFERMSDETEHQQ